MPTALLLIHYLTFGNERVFYSTQDLALGDGWTLVACYFRQNTGQGPYSRQLVVAPRCPAHAPTDLLADSDFALRYRAENRRLIVRLYRTLRHPCVMSYNYAVCDGR